MERCIVFPSMEVDELKAIHFQLHSWRCSLRGDVYEFCMIIASRVQGVYIDGAGCTDDGAGCIDDEAGGLLMTVDLRSGRELPLFGADPFDFRPFGRGDILHFELCRLLG
ncbi:hypothetical protein Ancab_002546 [Ancistrocladus abbreviatus]